MTMATPPALEWLWRADAQAALLVGLVLLARAAFGRWLSAPWRYRLWGLVVLRLLLPVTPASPVSVFNLLGRFGADEPAGPAAAAPADPPAAELAPTRIAADPAPGPAAPRVSVSARRPAFAVSRQRTPPAATGAGAGASHGRWGVAVAVVWLAGVAALSLRLTLTTRAFARRLRSARPVTGAAVLALLRDCAREAGLRRGPALLETDAVAGPAVVGVWRPRLLLPPGLAGRLSADELRLVFLHECAHLRHADVAGNWLLAALEIVHWFNPVVWCAFARCRADREMARDADVLTVAGGSGEPPTRAYGNVLLDLLKNAGPPAPPVVGVSMIPPSAAAGSSGRRGTLKQRMRMIAHFRPRRRFSVLGVLLMTSLGCATLTGPGAKRPAAQASGTPDAAVVTRVYDIRDLLVVVPDFGDAPSLRVEPWRAGTPRSLFSGSSSTGAGQGGAAPPPTRQERVEALTRLLTETVAPRTWHDAGGTVGAVRELSGSLVVMQTEANQRQIAQLLAQLREMRAVQVTVESRFIRIDDATLREIGLGGGPPGRPDSPATAPTPGAAATFLDERQVKLILRATQDQQNGCIITAPRVTLFNSQRAYVLVATDHAYVSNLKAAPATGPAARPGGYEPEMSVATSGVMLDLAATVSADRRYVTLTLHPQLSALQGIKDVPWPGRPEGSGLTIQEPRVKVSEVRTTVSIPDRRTLLLDGLDPGSLPDTAPDAVPDAATQLAGVRPQGPRRRLIVLVKPTIIIETPQDKTFPLLSTRLATTRADEP